MPPILACSLSALFANSTFQSFLSAIIGFILGVLWAEWKDTRRENRLKASYRLQLKEALKFNLDRLDHQMKIIADSNGTQLANFPLDTGILTQLMFSGRNIIGTDDEYRKWNWCRYKMEHINMAIYAAHSSAQPNLTGLLGLMNEAKTELCDARANI